MSSTIKAGTVYVQDYQPNASSNLYTLDLSTGQASLIGEIATETYDLTFMGNALYGLDKKDFGFRKTMKLIKIDPVTGKPNTVGDTWFDVVGLACNPVTQKLYATAHRKHQIVEVNPETGHAKPVVTLSDRTRSCGELAFDANGQAYISLIGTDLKKYLATCNMTTGQVNLIGDIGFPGLASMKFIDNTLYGVAGEYEGVGGRNGQLIRIDTATGQGTLFANTSPRGRWAGLAVYQPTPIPSTPSGEPTPIKEKPINDKPIKEKPINDGSKPIDDRTPVPPQPSVPHQPVGDKDAGPSYNPPEKEIVKPKVPVTVGGDHPVFNQLSFDHFQRNPATDIVCVAPIRTVIRREEEIVIIRRVRKVEEVDASPTCPAQTTQIY
ncbi:MAG: hypothetical protein AAGC93_04650 [Cyanobacteria bacterium P01_F01_bin.53]